MINLGNRLEQIKDKWKIFSQEPEVPEWFVQQQAHLVESSKRLEQEHQAMVNLSKMPGWQMLEGYLDSQIEVWRSQLEKKDDVDVRANIKAYRGLKRFVLSKVGVDVGQ